MTPGSPHPRLGRTWTPAVALVSLLSTLVAAPLSAEPVATFHFNLGGAYERLSYQEHVDPNGPDSVLTACTVDGEPGTCFIDSDAAANNFALHLDGRADFTNGFLLGGTFRTAITKGAAGETWTVAANLGGSPVGSQVFQTNDLEYRWLRFDIYCGYAIKPWLRPLGAIRISRAEQFRVNFRDGSGNPADIEATEPIDSSWFLVGVLGEHDTGRVVLGYTFQTGWPFTVTTTNTAIPGVEFTDVGGYVIEGGGSVGVPVGAGTLLKFGASGGKMHWEGSDIVQIGNTLAKWPENDTQFLHVTAGVELIR